MVEHQQVDFRQQGAQRLLLAHRPAHLPQRDGTALGVPELQGAAAAGQGDQPVTAAMQAPQQGLAEAA